MGNVRKIADRNYYENELKHKLIEIVNEIDSIKQKMKNHDADQIESAKLSKQQCKLLQEVRENEGQLADYNLALDKMRSGADIVNLQETTQQILNKNNEEKLRIDSIFLERKSLESQINEIEDDIGEIYEQMLHLSGQNEDVFSAMYGDYDRSEALIFEKEKNLSHIQCKYHNIRETLSSNEYAFHLKAMELQKELNALTQHKLELQQETNGSMDSETIKQKILEKVKSDNKVSQEAIASLNSTEDKLEELQNVFLQKEKDLKTMEQFSKQAHKYQQLFDRDRKMQAFLDAFDENYKSIADESDAIKQDNVGLMIHISDKQNGENKTDLRMDKIKSDISFKQQQKNEAQSTLVYSQKELDKINNLDTKIQAELKNLEEKQSDWKEQMQSFRSHDEIQSEYKRRKKELFEQKMKIQQEKESMEKRVLDIAQKSDEINRELNAYHNELKEMETKIAKLSQNIYSVQASITDYKREGEYVPMSEDIIAMQEQINLLLLKEMQMEI